MRITRSTPMVLLLPFLLMMLAGCEENTVGPGTGSGALLETEIDGVKYTLTPSVLQSQYFVSLQSGQFVGTAPGTPTRSLTVFIRTDLDNGTFPRTLTDGDASLIYSETTNGVTVNYDVGLDPSQSTLTITGKSTTSTGSMIVAGTFSGRLSNRDDRTKVVNLTNGKFSVDMSRQN